MNVFMLWLLCDGTLPSLGKESLVKIQRWLHNSMIETVLGSSGYLFNETIERFHRVVP